jgi:hypothetical protein
MIRIIVLTLFSLNVYAQNLERAILFDQVDPKQLTPKHIRDNKEVYLSGESLIQDKSAETGIYSEPHYTGLDKGRLSISYHVSHDYESFEKLQSIDFQLLSKISSYKDQWWGLQLKRVTAKYNALANEVSGSSTHPNANKTIERQDSLQSMTMIGFGFGHRFNILGDFFKSDRIFETLMAYGNYIYHLDGQTDDKYQGYGFSADYGIHKRMSQSFFYGGKLTYNLASLVREAKTNEDKVDRSLAFRWTSIAFEIGYFY